MPKKLKIQRDWAGPQFLFSFAHGTKISPAFGAKENGEPPGAEASFRAQRVLLKTSQWPNHGHISSRDVFHPFDEGRIEVWAGAGWIKVIKQGRHKIIPEND